MTRESLTFVEDFAVGVVVQCCLGIRTMKRDTTRGGEPFVSAEAFDRTGVIPVRIWDCEDPGFKIGDVVWFDAEVTEYKGKRQLNVGEGDTWEVVDPVTDEDRERVVRVSKYDPEELWIDLLASVESIQNPFVKSLVQAVIDEVEDALRIVPAAGRNHHAFRHGLLEHVVSMVKVGRLVATHYAELYPGKCNPDYVTAGCILHDLGKCWDFDEDGLSFRLTAGGRLVTHIPFGDHLVMTAAMAMVRDGKWKPTDKAAYTPVVVHLRHIVLSHHGRVDWGSPVPPKTLEAQLVHLVDMLDSRSAMFAEALDDVGEDGFNDYFRPLRGEVWDSNGTTSK